ncbi:MAG: beta-galactosidase [Phycisphaerae bacterium]|nr:beta-galactosidase [Phycisphaerae bacterium]
MISLDKGRIDSSGRMTIQPGGRVVLAVSLPLNVREPVLDITSSGPLKLRMISLGSAETIQLGETILWDDPKSTDPNTMRNRRKYLTEFVNRYSNQRNWDLPYTTTNGLYFITIQPVSEIPLIIKNISIDGWPLIPIKPFQPQVRVNGSIAEKEGMEQVTWPSPKSGSKWWGDAYLPAGRPIEANGIPFILCPTVLDKNRRSVGISVKHTAGAFHFAHCAGRNNQPWAGTYLIEYDDGATESVFAVLRWNCGVFQDNWMSRGRGDYTWWGPPMFSWASTYRVPDKSRPLSWRSVYIATVRNPHPEKTVKYIIAYVPGNNSELALLGISLTPVETTTIGLVEPTEAAIFPGHPRHISVIRWSAKPPLSGKAKRKLEMSKPDKSEPLGEIEINTVGHFSYGSAVITPKPDLLSPGPIRLTCDGVSSSLLGWMPAQTSEDKPNYLTMISSGNESPAELERIRRLGFDSVKVHMNWNNEVNPEPGKYDFSSWRSRFETIRNAGLKIGIRTPADGPDWLGKQIKPLEFVLLNGEVVPLTEHNQYDPADPAYRKALTDFYRAVGEFAAKYPDDVISINANYGVRFPIGSKNALRCGPYSLESFRNYLSEHYPLKDINSGTNMAFRSFDDITPQSILADNSGLLITEYTRHYCSLGASLQWDVARAIRDNSRAHLTFNHPYEPSERALLGMCFEEYLKIGRAMPPGAPFHETSDRYCLSFTKWLAARQTMGLPYGDEGNQNPPTYEHNVLSYMWMLRMQCWDSLYCQWWGGQPASRNIAWLKPYFRLIYNAEYMPDPITLALSFESGYYESPEVMRRGEHGTTPGHYGLANTLLAAHLNPKCYMMDAFPEYDTKAAGLLIDDSCRYLSDAFADRLEKFIRDGGVYLLTTQTDSLRDHAILRRFGVSFDENGIMRGKGVRLLYPKREILPAISMKRIGKGKLVLMDREFWRDFDPEAQEIYYRFLRRLFSKLGTFRPLVDSSQAGVYVVPYITGNNSVLVLVVNINPVEKTSNILLREDVLSAQTVTDLGTNRTSPICVNNGYYVVTTIIQPLSCTVLRFEK